MSQLLCFLMVFFSTSLPILSLIEPKNGNTSFTIELIHCDSPLSPFYNPSMTRAELLKNSVRRSTSRLNYFRLSSKHKKGFESMVIPDGSSYLMKLSIGTPPFEVFAVADTGSNIVWVQCKPCVKCYHQDSPIFDPLNSSSYQGLSCKSKHCQSLFPQSCGSRKKICHYTNSYGDKSFTKGDLATDTLTFGSTGNGHAVSFPKSVLGCGHQNGGLFSGHEEGIVGLGGGPLSLISQLGAVIQHRFSYCLVSGDPNATSKMRFGEGAKISGKKVVSTPLVPKPNFNHYHLTLEGISIGKKRVSANLGKLKGNIIIDSGTTYTYLESKFYNKLEAVLKDAIHLEPVVLKAPSEFKLCYPITSSISSFPDMMFHFEGADVNLNQLNTLVVVPNVDDIVFCLSILPSPFGNLSLFGSFTQTNFHVEYDLGKKRVSFAPADCTKY